MTNYDRDISYVDEAADLVQSEKMFYYLLKPLGERPHVFSDRYNLVSFLSDRNLYYTLTEKTFQKNYGNTEYDYKTSRK